MSNPPKSRRIPLTDLVTWATVAGNVLFVLWITANGINEGFRATRPEQISYVTLMGLLTINTFLLLSRRKNAALPTQSS